MPGCTITDKGLLAQTFIQTLSQPFPEWMAKAALPVWRPGVLTDPGIQKVLHWFFQLYISLHHLWI